MTLKLYFDMMSQPARACYLLFKCADIPFIPILTDLRKGEHLTENFKKISPFQKVPAIDDDGFHLTESVAIMKYALQKYKPNSSYLPSDCQLAAKIDEFLHWYHLNLRVNSAMYFRTLLLEPRVTGNPPDTKKAERFLGSMRSNLELMESYFLRPQQPFIGGAAHPSLADVLAVCELSQNDYTVLPVSRIFSPAAASAAANEDGERGRRLLKWYEAVCGATQPHFESVHRVLGLVRDKIRDEKANAKL